MHMRDYGTWPAARRAICWPGWLWSLALEARGLDASPAVRHKLLSAGDRKGAHIVERILHDEIAHVAIGTRWFHWLCRQRGLQPHEQQRLLARQYGAPHPRGPLNLAARRAAGFDEQELAQLQQAG